jgi:hypothetical protein
MLTIELRIIIILWPIYFGHVLMPFWNLFKEPHLVHIIFAQVWVSDSDGKFELGTSTLMLTTNLP